MSPRTRPRTGVAPLFAAALLFVAACGEDTKTRPDTTPDTSSDTADTVADATPDGSSCEGLAGTLDCPCRGDLTCDGELTCNSGTCQPAIMTGLELPAGARGCEVLLLEAGRVSDVRFAQGVRGTFVREAPRVVIAIVQESDADFAPGAVEILGTGSPLATVVKASCVDTSGAVLPNGSVTLR